MEKQLSIIIPTYNMEHYIGKCLDSLLVPEIDQLEIWVVNDGSKDRSSEIAHEYAKRYPQSINVIDKENGNYGSCINTALPRCTGRYIKILDADDTFNPTALSQFLHLLKYIDSDVILTDYNVVDENNNITKKCKTGIETLDNVSFNDIAPIISNHNQMHGLTYKTSLIRSLNYHQTERVSYTDTEWTFIPLASGQKYSVLNCGALYQYLVGRSDQTMSPKIFFKKLPDQFTVLKSRAKLYDEYSSKIEKERATFLEKSFLNQAHYIYLAIFSSTDYEAKNRLLQFEADLEHISNRLYNLVGNLDYTPSTHYKMVKAFRASKDPHHYHIPQKAKLLRKINGILRLIRLIGI